MSVIAVLSKISLLIVTSDVKLHEKRWCLVYIGTYAAQECFRHKKPLVESCALGINGKIQVLIPHITASKVSQEPVEKSIPIYAQEMFPTVVEHTIQVERRWQTGCLTACIAADSPVRVSGCKNRPAPHHYGVPSQDQYPRPLSTSLLPRIVVVTYMNVDIHSTCLILTLSCLKSPLLCALYTNLSHL